MEPHTCNLEYHQKIVIILSLFFLCLAGCSHKESYPPVTDEDNEAYCLEQTKLLESYDFSDPARDLEIAKAKDDFRYMAVRGFNFLIPDGNILIPNIDMFYDDLAVQIHEQKNYKIIEGTSDYYCSIKHGELNIIAEEYALEYNRLLYKFLSPNSEARFTMKLSNLSDRELGTLYEVLLIMASGKIIDHEDEFLTVIGVSLDWFQDMVARWPDIDERDIDVKIAINNTFKFKFIDPHDYYIRWEGLLKSDNATISQVYSNWRGHPPEQCY